MYTKTVKLESGKDLFFLDSEAELDVLNHLNDLIDSAHYVIFPHLSIAETFKNFLTFGELSEMYDNFCETKRMILPKAKILEMKKRKLELSHFDFVLFDKENYVPVLVIEVNGRSHATDEITKASDAFKEYVCKQVLGRPFLTLELFESQKDLKAALITAVKKSNFDRKYDYPIYCGHCGLKMDYLDKKDGSYYYRCKHCQEEDREETRSPEKIPPIFINI